MRYNFFMGMKNKIVLFFLIIVIGIFGSYLHYIHNKIPDITIETKISQMIVVGFDNSDTSVQNIKKYIKNNKISGVIFYKRNINSPSQIKKQISQFNRLSNKKYPLFIMTDQEGGRVSRISSDNGFKNYKSAEYIAKNFGLNES